MKTDLLFNPLRLSLRQGNMQGITFHLARLKKKAGEATCPHRLKTEIYLEAVKAFRALDRQTEAEQLCDVAIANIPANSFDLLSALKRLRSLIYLDAGDFISARNRIDETDGLELILQGNASVVQRNDTDVTVETWLVSMEIAMAQKDIASAQDYFEKAVSRLSSEESELRRKRIALMDRKKIEQYYHDLSQMLNLYSLTLSLITGDMTARRHLTELFDAVADENKIALAEKKLPNVPLHSKLLCLLGKWSDMGNPPSGIPLAEARRWAAFGSPEYLKNISNFVAPAVAETAEPAFSSALVSLPTSQMGFSSENLPANFGSSSASENALSATATAIERMANIFGQIEKALPEFTNYLRGEKNVDFTQRGWSGHLLSIDLHNFLHNIKLLQFTGYVKFSWGAPLYERAIMKGILPEIVRAGEAYLYAAEGFVIDAVFKGQDSTTVEKAQENFLLITRMCYCIQVDDIQPDILGTAVPDQNVAERPRLIKIRDNDLLFITSDLDEAAAGIEKETGESAESFDELEEDAPEYSAAKESDGVLLEEDAGDLFTTQTEEKPNPANQETASEKEDEELLEIT